MEFLNRLKFLMIMADMQRMGELHGIYNLNGLMYPKYKESEHPAIMDFLDLFRRGFNSSDKTLYNLTKSTLSKILKNFAVYSKLIDPLFVLGNVRFMTKLFDIEKAKAQIRAYLKSPYTIKNEQLITALDKLLGSFPNITPT